MNILNWFNKQNCSQCTPTCTRNGTRFSKNAVIWNNNFCNAGHLCDSYEAFPVHKSHAYAHTHMCINFGMGGEKYLKEVSKVFSGCLSMCRGDFFVKLLHIENNKLYQTIFSIAPHRSRMTGKPNATLVWLRQFKFQNWWGFQCTAMLPFQYRQHHCGAQIKLAMRPIVVSVQIRICPCLRKNHWIWFV